MRSFSLQRGARDRTYFLHACRAGALALQRLLFVCASGVLIIGLCLHTEVSAQECDVRVLEPNPGDNRASATTILENGAAVLQSYGGVEEFPSTSMLVHPDGGRQPFPNAPGTYVIDMSERGNVVYAYGQTFAVGATPTSTPSIVPLPAGFTEMDARALLEDGTVVGGMYSGRSNSGFTRSFDGRFTVLSSLIPEDGNNLGDLAGWSTFSVAPNNVGPYPAFKFRGRPLIYPITPPSPSQHGFAVQDPRIGGNRLVVGFIQEWDPTDGCVGCGTVCVEGTAVNGGAAMRVVSVPELGGRDYCSPSKPNLSGDYVIRVWKHATGTNDFFVREGGKIIPLKKFCPKIEEFGTEVTEVVKMTNNRQILAEGLEDSGRRVVLVVTPK